MDEKKGAIKIATMDEGSSTKVRRWNPSGKGGFERPAEKKRGDPKRRSPSATGGKPNRPGKEKA